ncbi:MAG: lamin tail domain-containing protein [Bacteroidaceae bacterium]|nr:lamin tail domain-containing protein [Bacteroidaceae bacterium]
MKSIKDASWRIGTLIVLCLCGQQMRAQAISVLRINEIMVANVEEVIDPTWNYGSWIEVYNSSTKEQNLQGMWLSDESANLKKVHIKYDTPVPPRGFATLWLGHHSPYWPKQLDMKLDCDGGRVYLSDENGVIQQVVQYPEAISRCSYARVHDGAAQWAYTGQPSPGATNNNSTFCETRLPAPEVSVESQVFTRTVAFNVNIPEGATLRYTIDGTIPTLENGTTSPAGEFRVAFTTIYRFRLFKDGELSSPVVTRSFIRKDKNFNIPVVSLVTTPDNLYGDKIGVFVKGTNGRRGKGTSEYCNWNQDWDRPVNLEIFDKDGGCMLNIEGELSRCGGHSKGFTPFSFKVKASKKYEGQDFMPSQMFPDRPFLKHKMLQFRCGGNDYLCRIRDAALQSIVRTSGIDIDLQNYQPVCHYINGQFMGTINMREPNNRHNVYANFGLDDDEIDMFEIDCDSCYIQMCGTRDAWTDLVEMSARAYNPDVYEEIMERLDVDELCNYMAIQFYLCNVDWPQNNCKGWRPIREGGKFRFVLYDVDLTFSYDNPFSAFAGRRWYTFCQLFDVPGVSHYTREVELVPLFQNLLQNDDFRRHFIDAFCIVSGSVFDPDRCTSTINRLATIAYPMQVRESGYLGRNVSPWGTANEVIDKLSNHAGSMHSALRNTGTYKLSQAKRQKIEMKANIPHARLQINGQTVTTGYFNGRLYAPTKLRALAPMGYHFVGWHKDSPEGELMSSDEEMTMPTISDDVLKLVACYEPDEEILCPVVINEVSAGNSVFVNEYYKKNDWVELYNVTDKDIDLEGMYLSDDNMDPGKYRISSEGTGVSTIIPANGYKVIWCDKLPTKTQLHANFKLGNENNQYIFLSAPNGEWADTLIYCAHEGGESVGRFPDGGSKLYRMYRPTIDAANKMNSYTTPWVPTEHPQGGVGVDMAHSGSLGLIYRQDMLVLKSEEEIDATLAIYTLDGRLAMREGYHIAEGQEQVRLWMLAPGVYVARLSDDDGNQCTVKFVKK